MREPRLHIESNIELLLETMRLDWPGSYIILFFLFLVGAYIM